MAFPAGLTTILVRHKVTDAAGKALRGNLVTAVPVESVWTTGGSIIEHRATATIDADGNWQLTLPHTDQAGIQNRGVPWKVTEHVPGGPRTYLVAPMVAHGAGPIDVTAALVSPGSTPRQTIIQAGPVTDETATSLLDRDTQFRTRITGTIATQTEPIARASGRDAAIDALADQPAVIDAAAVRAVSVATDPAIAGAIDNTTSATRATLDTHYSRAHTFDSTKYGAGPTRTWQQNRDAINAAINAAHTAGKGVVLLPPGRVTVKGIIQRSYVELRAQGTTLVHPDGTTGHIIASEQILTTGSISAGSETLTVANAAGIHPGSVVSIRGAGGRNEAEIWTLAATITATQTTGIALATSTGAFTGASYLNVGGEVIGYTSIDGAGVLQGVTRGMYGTTATTHSAGAWIGQAARMYARVAAKNGNTLTLDRPAVLGVTNAPVDSGPVEPRISGNLAFYGNRPAGGAADNPYPVVWTSVGGGIIDSITADRCESALMLDRGTSGCQIGSITAHECGNAPVKGSAIWLFRGVSENKIGAVTITGADTYVGLYIDDRTVTASEYDGPCMGNTVASFTATRPHTGTTSPADGVGINITGSGRNTVANVTITGFRFPVVISGTSQNQRPDGTGNPYTYGNSVVGGSLTKCHRPWSVTAPGNTLMGLYWESVQGTVGEETVKVTKVAVSEASGAAPSTPVRFANGTKAAPSITFEDDPDTGIYRVGDGDLAIASNGEWVYRIRPNDMMLNDGKNIQVGTGVGTRIGASATQKLGFFGQTPVTRRPGLGTVPTDAPLSTVITKLNSVMVGLRELGLFDA